MDPSQLLYYVQQNTQMHFSCTKSGTVFSLVKRTFVFEFKNNSPRRDYFQRKIQYEWKFLAIVPGSATAFSFRFLFDVCRAQVFLYACFIAWNYCHRTANV